MTPKEALDFLVNNLPVEAQQTTSIYHTAIRVLLQSLTELEFYKSFPQLQEASLIPEVNLKLVTCELQLRELKRTAHEKLIEMGLTLKVTKNYAGGVFSHEWWNDNDDRVIVFYIGEKVTTVYEGSNEIMDIIPQYLEELEDE